MTGSAAEGTVALVTGAGSGIGAAVARLLAERGALVAAVERDEYALRTVVEKLVADGRHARAYPCDVSDRHSVDDVCAQVTGELGPLRLLVNVAGVLRIGSTTELSDEDWLATFAVNTHGVFYASRAAARYMKGQGGGAIITVGSNAAEIPRSGMAAYAASKAATTQFTKCLGLELAPYDIRCNVVSPGSTETPMQHAMWRDGRDRDHVIRGDLETYRPGIPLGGLADPMDVAHAVAFLASDQARHITMHNMYVDGGASLR